MASTYALPVSPLPHSPHNHFRQHSHGGHSHNHSHSHSHNRPSSPSKLAPAGARAAYSPRVMRNESMHSRSQSVHTHSHGHVGHDNHNGKVSPVYEDLAIPPYGNSDLPSGKSENTPYPNNDVTSPLYSEFTGVDFSKPVDDHPHEDHTHGSHSHEDHCGHVHHAKAVEPRSRFTTLLLKHTLNFPLLQSILLEKDSRRIFYFMR